MQNKTFDVLIIGSGAAGLSLALRLPRSLCIGVIAKGSLTEGNTYYAQGGISAVLDKTDSTDSHIADTLNAGAGLCDESTVRLVVEKGPESIQWLLEEGVSFTRNKPGGSGYHLTREGGHSHRRVIHAADATGKEVESTLQEQAQARKNIHLFEYHNAIDLIIDKNAGDLEKRCFGAYILDKKSGLVETFRSRFTVLATGGASKVYLYTSNPDVSTNKKNIRVACCFIARRNIRITGPGRLCLPRRWQERWSGSEKSRTAAFCRMYARSSVFLEIACIFVDYQIDGVVVFELMIFSVLSLLLQRQFNLFAGRISGMITRRCGPPPSPGQVVTRPIRSFR